MTFLSLALYESSCWAKGILAGLIERGTLNFDLLLEHLDGVVLVEEDIELLVLVVDNESHYVWIGFVYIT